MEQTKEKKMYLRIRNLCGGLGVALPWLALLSAGLFPHPSDQWWWSISATYYQSPALVGVLVPASLVLLTYVGYDKLDNWITSLSGFFGLCIVLFPCKVNWLPVDAEVGFFQIPMAVSNIIHGVSAAIFFLLLAYNSALLFTKTGSGEMSKMKKIRNNIYKVCGWGMLVVEIIFACCKIFHGPGYLVMIVEIILLTLFGISWLVKGEAIKWLND